MGRGRSKFKQGDVAKAVRAVTSAGVKVSRVEIDAAGRIVVVTADGATFAPDEAEVDDWMKKHVHEM
jgi:hypothetical protein